MPRHSLHRLPRRTRSYVIGRFGTRSTTPTTWPFSLHRHPTRAALNIVFGRLPARTSATQLPAESFPHRLAFGLIEFPVGIFVELLPHRFEVRPCATRASLSAIFS